MIGGEHSLVTTIITGVVYDSIGGPSGDAGHAMSQRQFVYDQQLVLLSELV